MATSFRVGDMEMAIDEIMLNRRSLLSRLGTGALAAGVVAVIAMAAYARPVPRPALLDRMVNGPDIIGMVCWGLNTYTDKEWGYGDVDPKLLNPAKFDADQIVGAAKAGGIGGLVIVAKHHDGFCLWPTKTTDYNITKTPFWKGTGNVSPERSEPRKRSLEGWEREEIIEKGSDPSIEDPLYMIRMPADRSFYTIYTSKKGRTLL